ncbi:reverse transcriptase Ty1/copia-type domain-containing protein [Haematococcus lacustris]|uniref:Reverse transcriptase Ty1/copia-type domain-containing protein n=1 Tax=Haematococcus lacustris TaxID=44745 RepID=A0A6A0A559_HAELA|nr:reverse transcriptase Ty1/copia-type domain-containing protein [Haematococcus lacustris]
MELEHLNVMTAFEEIYMQQPAGYEDGTARVCRLRRALYGLRQAPRAWHARLKAELEQLGFVASEADSCLFTMVRGSSKVLLAVYVDDCLLAVSKGDTATVAWVKEQLAAVFNIHQLGSAERFLITEISRDRAAGQLVLSQERYATSVVDRFGLADSKPRSVPLSTSEQLVKEGEVQPHMGGHSYAELSKHIDVLHHFVRERAARGEVVFKFCESEANVADGMTKALPRAKFEFCKAGMGMMPGMP